MGEKGKLTSQQRRRRGEEKCGENKFLKAEPSELQEKAARGRK